MIDKETYKKELVRMWDSVREIYKCTIACTGVTCEKCPLNQFEYGCSSPLSAFEIYETVEKWSKEHPQKKYKVSRMEYDILYNALDFSSNDDTFDDIYILHGLLENGYFNGATNGMRIREYFENCEIEVDK